MVTGPGRVQLHVVGGRGNRREERVIREAIARWKTIEGWVRPRCQSQNRAVNLRPELPLDGWVRTNFANQRDFTLTHPTSNTLPTLTVLHKPLFGLPRMVGVQSNMSRKELEEVLASFHRNDDASNRERNIKFREALRRGHSFETLFLLVERHDNDINFYLAARNGGVITQLREFSISGRRK